MYRQRAVVIPPGLMVLLEGLSNAVVRYQPENVVNFGSIYFNALLEFKAERTERAALSLDELVEEFKATKGSHFYKKQVRASVDSAETFPRPKPIQEWEAGLVEARHLPFPGNEISCLDSIRIHQVCSSDQIGPTATAPPVLEDIQAPVQGARSAEAECVSATTITLSSGPIPIEIAQELTVYRRKRDHAPPEDSRNRQSSPCVRVRSALFERISLSKIDRNADTVLIRTGSLPQESQILVQTDGVPDLIIFQADPRLSENEATSPCCAMIGAPENMLQLEVMGTALNPSIAHCDAAAPGKLSNAIMSEPAATAPGGKVIVPEAFAAMVEPLDLPAPAMPDPPASAIQEVAIPPPVLIGTKPGYLVWPPAGVLEVASYSSPMSCPIEAAEEMSVPMTVCSPETSYFPDLPATAANARVAESSSQRSLPRRGRRRGSEVEEVSTRLGKMFSVLNRIRNLISPTAAVVTVETPAETPMRPLPMREEDIQAPVPESVPLLPPGGASAPCLPAGMSAEAQTQCAPCPPPAPLGETRTPYLVYLPLPIELAKTPSLVCQVGPGPEETRGLPFICVPVAPTELPRTPSNVTNAVGVQELPRTLALVCPPDGSSNLSRNNSQLFSPADAAPWDGRSEMGYCPFSFDPQGGPRTTGTQTQIPHPASLQQQPGTAMLNNGLYTDFMPHCSHEPSHQRPADVPMTYTGAGPPDCSCPNLHGTSSHWRLCHLTRPESQGRMACPYQTSMAMLHLERMANVPMYQDCGRYCSSHCLQRSCSSHGSLQAHTMAEPRCPAHNLGTFVQPCTCSDPLFYLPQQYSLMTSPSQVGPGMCPLACPMLQRRQSSLLMCGHQGELPLHSRGSNTNNPNPGFVMNCNPRGN